MSAARSFRIAMLVGTVLLAGSCASVEHRRSGPELLVAAERSFSDVPFGTREAPPGLTRIDDAGCRDEGECTYLDANQVGHSFADDGALVVKWIEVARLGDRPINALGIGSARTQNEVVGQVKRFLPEADVDCDELRPQEATLVCGAMLGKGWIRLFFDRSRRLTEVRIDAYHFT